MNWAVGPKHIFRADGTGTAGTALARDRTGEIYDSYSKHCNSYNSCYYIFHLVCDWRQRITVLGIRIIYTIDRIIKLDLSKQNGMYGHEWICNGFSDTKRIQGYEIIACNQ